MDKIKKLVYQNQDKLKYVLLASASIGAFNCFSRFDYNLVLFLYIYYIWFMSSSKELDNTDKPSTYFILLYSLIIDLIWVFYWGSRWSRLKGDYEWLFHFLVVLFSWIGIGLKIITIISITIIEWSNIRSTLPEQLQEKLNEKL